MHGGEYKKMKESAFNIEKITKDNDYFRYVIYTTSRQQLVIMSVEDLIPLEIHPNNDQFIKIEAGKCHITLENDIFELEAGDSITIPAGHKHEVRNILQEPVKLYTIYSPPHHPENLVQKCRPLKD